LIEVGHEKFSESMQVVMCWCRCHCSFYVGYQWFDLLAI